MVTDYWSQFWRHESFPARPMALVGDEPPRRPDDVRHVPFEVCLGWEYDSALAEFRRAVVPIQVVEPGDRQVVVPGRIGRDVVQHVVDLDLLADVDTVESVIVDAPVVLRTPLPHVRTLVVTTGVAPPSSEVLAHLPNLEQLCLGRSPAPRKIDWAVLAGMARLRDLRLHAWHIGTIEPIGRLGGLRRVLIEDHTFESIAPLAACEALEYLAVGWWKGMTSLGSLARLRRVELNEGTVANLRAFRRWTELRALVVFGRRLKSLDGIQAFGELEDLYLYGTAVSDLSPLTELPSLRRLRLDLPDAVTDFGPLARLDRLESLTVNFKGSHPSAVPRLGDVAGLSRLEELALTAVDPIGAKMLLDLPRLRRLRLGAVLPGDVEAALHGRGAELSLAAPSAHSVATAAPEFVDGRWIVHGDFAPLLGVADDFEVERRVRDALSHEDPALVARLEFDSDAELLTIVAGSEPDARAVARALDRLKGRD